MSHFRAVNPQNFGAQLRLDAHPDCRAWLPSMSCDFLTAAARPTEQFKPTVLEQVGNSGKQCSSNIVFCHSQHVARSRASRAPECGSKQAKLQPSTQCYDRSAFAS